MIPTAGNKCAFSSRPCGRGRVVAHALFPMFATASIMIMATTTHSNWGNVDAEFASLYKEALKPCGKPFCDLFPCYQHHEGKKPQSRQKLKKNHLCRRRRRIFHPFFPSHSWNQFSPPQNPLSLLGIFGAHIGYYFGPISRLLLQAIPRRISQCIAAGTIESSWTYLPHSALSRPKLQFPMASSGYLLGKWLWTQRIQRR